MTVIFADVDVYFWHACFIREVLIKQIYLHFYDSILLRDPTQSIKLCITVQHLEK